IVQIAQVLSSNSKERPLAALPAYRHLRLPTGTELQASDLLDAKAMFR
ncbi:histidine kinase, partial [Pseudomonas frederiksbergensis]|nr:histidine kinase [Pseudomonas frederiksbergensis]